MHLRAYGMDLDEVRDRRGLAFLLSRIAIRMYRPLYAQDEIEIETWVSDGQGLGFLRCFRILRGGEVMAEAVSVWALLELSTKRLLRNDEFSYPFDGDEPLKLELPQRFRVPKTEELERVGDRRIVYSDIDYNGHMNNTRYPDMLCDFTPEIEAHRVTGVVLSYLHEATYGKTLAVYRTSPKEGEYLFRTVDPAGTTCLEARLLVE